VPNTRPRLSVAVAAVEGKGKAPPLDFLHIFFVSELSALPADERDAIRAYVSQRVTPRYSLSPAGADFIFGMEDFRPYMYEDQAGHCTIGYGFLVHKGPIDGRPAEAPFVHGITKAAAREQAMGRVHGFEDHRNQKAKVELTQYQVDALISFIYNAGALHELEGPVNEANYEAIPDLLLRTRVGKGKASLLTRRRAEAALFARGDYSWRITKDKG
jgi:GH24 family phage-related lysozyme (muramidase)